MPADRASVALTVLVAVLLALALSPLLFVEIPAMHDYVNHLARMKLIAASTPPAAYEVVWKLYPNLAMDIVVPMLGRLVGVEVAGKIFLAVAQVLVVSGAIAIEWATKREHRLSGLGAMLVLFSLPFAWGLMNFTFGMGLTVWGIAAWIALREHRPLTRWLVHAGFVLAIFVSHFFALGIYGLVIGLIELSRLTRRPLNLRESAGLVAFMASPPLILMGVMLLAGGRIGGSATDWAFEEKLFWPLLFMNVYNVALGLLIWASLILLVAALAFSRRLKLVPTGVWIALGLLVVYIALPRRLFGVAYLDIRLLTAAGLILPAFMTYRPPAGALRHAPLMVMVCMISLTQVSVARAWIIHQVDYRQMRASFAKLKPGTAVFVARWDGPAGDAMDNQPLNYAPTLAAPEAGVFVSALYTARGMQPLQAAPAFRPIEVQEAMEYLPPHVRDLRANIGPGSQAAAFMADWPSKYDYLYILGAPQPNPFRGRLEELSRGRKYVLYAIKP